MSHTHITVNIYHEFFINYHFADNGVNHGLVQLKHARQNVQTERVVDVAVWEQICTQTLLLDLLLYHVTHTVGVVKQVPHLHTSISVKICNTTYALCIWHFHCFVSTRDITGFERRGFLYETCTYNEIFKVVNELIITNQYPRHRIVCLKQTWPNCLMIIMNTCIHDAFGKGVSVPIHMLTWKLLQVSAWQLHRLDKNLRRVRMSGSQGLHFPDDLLRLQVLPSHVVRFNIWGYCFTVIPLHSFCRWWWSCSTHASCRLS